MADLIHVGVTGTRHPLPEPQLTGLAGVLSLITAGHESEPLVLHHGVCTGADETAHRIARNLGGWTIHGHPGHDVNGKSPWRSLWALDDLDVMEASKPYPVRNADIVIAGRHGLIAVPAYPEKHRRSRRSGSWRAVRCGRRYRRRITLVWPDGSTEADQQ